MKKVTKLLALVLALVMMVSCFAACGETPDPNPNPGGNGGGTGDNGGNGGSGDNGGNGGSGDNGGNGGSTDNKPLAGTYDIKVWVAEAIVELTKTQIANFNATNDQGIVINATVEPVGEGDAATSMTQDVAAGADIFGFAQDQTARLIQAGALSQLGTSAANLVKEKHDKASVTAVTSGDALYGYPMTSDNGYFMYYDKSVISEEDVGSLEALIAACKAAGKNFSFELENSWYIVSFFFATGCLSEWTTDDEGKFVDVNDNFNSEAGKIAAEGLKKLVTESIYVNSSATSDFAAAIPSAVVVSGTWNYENAKSLLGENFGVAELPSFTVGENTYHLGSYNGCKLMGVKPQTDAKKAAVVHMLAQYLTDATCQLERFEGHGWGPSNVEAQASDAVKAAPHLTALMAQNNYSRPQGQIHGSWWDIAKVIATSIKGGMSIDEALANYQASMEELFTLSDDILNAWTVIGNINGDGWSVDLTMTEQGDGTWKTDEAYELSETTEFKVRQGKSWDNNYGANGEANGANVTIAGLGVEAGTYYIVFDSNTGMISVVPAE